MNPELVRSFLAGVAVGYVLSLITVSGVLLYILLGAA
jgi:hypothetical protein